MLRGLFGEIRQTEIGAECAYHVSEGVGIKLADEPVETGAFMRAVLFLEADVAAPQVFNGGIHIPTNLGAQDVAQYFSQQHLAGAQLFVAHYLRYSSR